MKDTNTNKSSVLKQLFGAVVGATVALGIYYVYDFGSPVVSAWLISNKVTSDETPVVINDIDEFDTRLIESQARKVASHKAPVELETTEDESVWAREWKTEEDPVPEPKPIVKAVGEIIPEPKPLMPITDPDPEPMPRDPKREPIERTVVVPIDADVTELPSSGFELWLLFGISGAAGGLIIAKRKSIA